MATRILVVDEPGVQQSMELNRSRAGQRVTTCRDAAAAQQRLADSLPEMLVLEWDLPGQSGVALTRRLRAGAATRDLPIIMLPSRAGSRTRSWRSNAAPTTISPNRSAHAN